MVVEQEGGIGIPFDQAVQEQGTDDESSLDPELSLDFISALIAINLATSEDQERMYEEIMAVRRAIILAEKVRRGMTIVDLSKSTELPKETFGSLDDLKNAAASVPGVEEMLKSIGEPIPASKDSPGR